MLRSVSLLTRPRQRNSHRADAIKRCPSFLKWLRTRDCALVGTSGHECRGKVRACHVDYAGDKGVATKVSDRFAVPMCDGAHEEQHRIGWSLFERKHLFDALSLSRIFWQAWPGRLAWERDR